MRLLALSLRWGRVLALLLLLHVSPASPRAPASRAHAAPRARTVHEKFPELKKWRPSQNPLKVLGLSLNRTRSWSRPRCGVPDFPALHDSAPLQRDSAPLQRDSAPLQRDSAHRGQRQRRFVLYGGRLDKTHLTYRIVRFPWQLREEKVRRVFKEALKIWSDVTPLTFTEVQSGKADIRIDFTRYWHGDNLPFDGPGGILAHAFFPKTHRQGDIHFDYDETWTLGNHMGTDLLQVAAHEFGHVLGLQHSREPGAVMSAYYSFSYPLRLTDDDRRGIQYLYGARVRADTPTAPPAPPPPAPQPPETNEILTPPDVCQTDFDAVALIRGELFFFRSGYVWRIREGRLESGYPALASRHWPGLPLDIDAAFEDKSGNIWFFQGDRYWVFDAQMQQRGPEPLSSLALPVASVSAALRWGRESSFNTFLFGGGSFWRFSPKEERVDGPARSMGHWSGVPGQVDAAFRDIYGYAHFTRGRQYWKLDPAGMNSLEGYPRLIGVDFFGCRSV